MPAIVIHVNVAWSFRLSHMCILQKSLDGMRWPYCTDTRVVSVKMVLNKGLDFSTKGTNWSRNLRLKFALQIKNCVQTVTVVQ